MTIPLSCSKSWRPNPIQWWDIDLRKKIHGLTDEQYSERYLEIFEDSVKLRLRSDVPVGTCFSGGIDSSGIVCMVNRLQKKEGMYNLQKTFTSVSDYPEYDEREYAQEVINTCRVIPFFVLPTPEQLLEDLPKLL